MHFVTCMLCCALRAVHAKLCTLRCTAYVPVHAMVYTSSCTRCVVHARLYILNAELYTLRYPGGGKTDWGGRREHSQDITKTSTLSADVGSMSVVNTYSSLGHLASYHHLHCSHTGLTQRHGYAHLTATACVCVCVCGVCVCVYVWSVCVCVFSLVCLFIIQG